MRSDAAKKGKNEQTHYVNGNMMVLAITVGANIWGLRKQQSAVSL
jgi:hypothetical protein